MNIVEFMGVMLLARKRNQKFVLSLLNNNGHYKRLKFLSEYLLDVALIIKKMIQIIWFRGETVVINTMHESKPLYFRALLQVHYIQYVTTALAA